MPLSSLCNLKKLFKAKGRKQQPEHRICRLLFNYVCRFGEEDTFLQPLTLSESQLGFPAVSNYLIVGQVAAEDIQSTADRNIQLAASQTAEQLQVLE